MVYSTSQMRKIALAEALDKGPRPVRVGDKTYIGYWLSKKELAMIFVDHNYSANRIAWLKQIRAWGDPNLWGDLVPTDNRLFEANDWQWKVIFMDGIRDDKVLESQMAAEDEGIPLILPRDRGALVS